MVALIIGSGFRLGIKAWEKGESEARETQRLRAFVTSFVEPRGGGFKWVRYSYSEGSLVFTEGKLPDKNFLDKIAENEEVIDSDIGEVTFEYLSSFEEEWQESWDLGEGIPVAVRVKIAYFQPFFITLPMGLVDSGKKI
jgi:hypothetical protein